MINKWLLNSTARFSPPDDLGSTGGDTNNDNTTVVENNEAPIVPEVKETRVESIRDSIKGAFKEAKEKAEIKPADKTNLKPTNGADAGDKTVKPSSDTKTTDDTKTALQAKSGPPVSWKAEEKAIWDSLPDAAKAAINRREADTTKGVQELKTKYQDIDTAVAPYHAVMKQNNVTPAQAINQLFKWHMELAGPNKVQAFQQLAKNFGIDPATLATVQSQLPNGADQNTQIPDNLKPIITGLETRLKSFEEQNALQTQNAAKQTWANWSKDKTHAEKVRGLMANLINSDMALIQAGQPQVSNTINSAGSIDMDAAYNAAIYAHPETRALVLQEEQAKKDAEAKAAAEKARKAAKSLNTGAPAGKLNGSNGSAPKVQSIKDSIVSAIAEVRNR